MTRLQKTASIILYILMGVSLLFAILYYGGGATPETDGTPVEEMKFTGGFLTWSVVLLVIAGVSTLLFSIFNIITHPKVLKGFLISLGAGAVLLLISFGMASGEALPNLPDSVETTERALKWAGTGLNATYILAVLAFFGIIASEVIRVFK